MKKNQFIKKLFLGATMILSLNACTKDFEEINVEGTWKEGIQKSMEAGAWQTALRAAARCGGFGGSGGEEGEGVGDRT